jgi:hypothetical protein
LSDDGVQAFADLRLLVHLHVQAVRHLVVLKSKTRVRRSGARCEV